MADDGGESPPALSRRRLLATAGATGLATTLAGGRLDPPPEGRGVAASPDTDRHWLGPSFWGNRLQDWRYDADRDRIVCTTGAAGHEVRTVAALTRELTGAPEPGRLRVRTGIAEDADGGGFCGFLVGTGSGDLDYRGRALVQRASGRGGGLLCTYETDGGVRFREHTDERTPLAYAAQSPASAEAGPPPAVDEPVDLVLDVEPGEDGAFTLAMRALDADTGDQRAAARLAGVPASAVGGGIALVSSPSPGEDGPRWWFEDLETAGAQVATHPDRTFGPVAGTLFSLDARERVLKLSAQFLPVGRSAPGAVRLRYRPRDAAADEAAWRTATSSLREGYLAPFRVEDWDLDRAWTYEVVYEGLGGPWRYEGTIPAEPDDELTVALFSCTSATGARLDEDHATPPTGEGRRLGRYTPRNVYVPYGTLTESAASHDPDLLAFVGDQYYERSPTRPDPSADPKLDHLYRWALWHWSFRDLTRDTPTVVLTDDHDVYQPNVWGAGADRENVASIHAGGFERSVDFVNRARFLQSGHNPDPSDPTPVGRGVDVYYGGFAYGGASIAMLEDRTFKAAPAAISRFLDDTLLGARQLSFLDDWAADGGGPRLCLTQTVFASALTDGDGRLKSNHATNGWPSAGRDRALRRLRDAGALVLAGDHHLPLLLRHGIDGPADGPLQFAGPAGGAVHPRWFDPPAGPTGDYTDPFGNRFETLAVANPAAAQTDGFQHLYDRADKPEGYGVVRVDHEDEAFVVECWPADRGADDPADAQFDGWPHRVPFESAGGPE